MTRDAEAMVACPQPGDELTDRFGQRCVVARVEDDMLALEIHQPPIKRYWDFECWRQEMRGAVTRTPAAAAMPDKRYERLLVSFTELQQLAQAVLDATDQNLDTKEPPQKFGAPYGPLAKLRVCLDGHRGLRPPPGAAAAMPEGDALKLRTYARWIAEAQIDMTPIETHLADIDPGLIERAALSATPAAPASEVLNAERKDANAAPGINSTMTPRIVRVGEPAAQQDDGLSVTQIAGTVAAAAVEWNDAIEAAANKAADMRPRGGRQWTDEQHASYAALTDCATAIRALRPTPTDVDAVRARNLVGEWFVTQGAGFSDMADRITSAFAQVRADEREADAAQDALVQIKQWCDAYPVKVFSEPDFDKARAALETVGITLDAMHGTWARHLLEGIGKIATAAIRSRP